MTLLSPGGGSPACACRGPQDPVPSPGTAAGMHGERDEPLRLDRPPLQDLWANRCQGGWTEDGLRKPTAPPPSLPRAGGREGRGAGAGTMGCGADSNSQFLVASSPPPPPGLELAEGGGSSLLSSASFRSKGSRAQERAASHLRPQPWPRQSGSWHPGTGEVRQAAWAGAGGGAAPSKRSGQRGRWSLRAPLALQGKSPGRGELSGMGSHLQRPCDSHGVVGATRQRGSCPALPSLALTVVHSLPF